MLVSSLPQASAAAPAAAEKSAAEAATSAAPHYVAAVATKAVAVPDLFASVAVLESQPVERTLFRFGPSDLTLGQFQRM